MTNRILLLKKMAFAAGIVMLMAGSVNADLVCGTVDLADDNITDGGYTWSGLSVTDAATMDTITFDLVGTGTFGIPNSGGIAQTTNGETITFNVANATSSLGNTVTFESFDAVTLFTTGGNQGTSTAGGDYNFTGAPAISYGPIAGDVSTLLTLDQTAGDLTELTFLQTERFTRYESIKVQFDSVAAVPEPSSLALLAAGLGMIGLRRRR